MGMFDNVGSFFNGIGDGLGSLFSSVKRGAGELFDAGISLIRSPGEIVKKGIDKGAEVVKAVTSDVKDTVIGASKEVGGAVSNLGQSFAWPIALAVGGVGALYVLKGKA